MRKITSLLVGAALMMATNALAIPTLTTGYTWTDASFWTNTDTTTGPADGNSQFLLKFENASYESDFGLFTVTGTAASPTAIDTKFKIFDMLDEPVEDRTVIFRSDGSISLDGIYFTSFDTTFGFYFDVHTGGAGDSTVDYSFYSYDLFNTGGETGLDHILTAYNSLTHQVMIYLDDQLVATGGSDRDFNDMIVKGNDLSPAPVPEPGTMVLLGFGMLGLAIYGKRRMNKDS